jgi:hypothetical protein
MGQSRFFYETLRDTNEIQLLHRKREFAEQFYGTCRKNGVGEMHTDS